MQRGPWKTCSATNRDAIGAMIDEWTTAASAMRRMADQVDRLVAENRPGPARFHTGRLVRVHGLAQDAQRMLDQINRVTEELERDPRDSCLATAPKASGRIEH